LYAGEIAQVSLKTCTLSTAGLSLLSGLAFPFKRATPKSNRISFYQKGLLTEAALKKFLDESHYGDSYTICMGLFFRLVYWLL